jgi:hypothetical protein
VAVTFWTFSLALSGASLKELLTQKELASLAEVTAVT